MNLWVRSQDKETLMIVHTLTLATDKIGTIIGYGTDQKTKIILGEYQTKERALEVLDEIHQRLLNLQCIELIGTSNITQQMKRNGVDCVYEMPID